MNKRNIDSFIYEQDSGARPENVVITWLNELESADIYIGLFAKYYRKVTVDEYRHARRLEKPCFIYIRNGIEREQELIDFLKEASDPKGGVNPKYFDSALELGEIVANDILTWLISGYRDMTAKVNHAPVSETEIDKIRSQVDSHQAVSRERLPQGISNSLKLFVCYSRRDSDFAKEIYKYFIDFNYEVFTDVNTITAGDVWNTTIEENISKCDVFVVIITHAAVRSREVENEVSQAQRERKRIIPCIYESVKYSEIKWGLDKIQGITFDNRYELTRKLYDKI